MLGALTSEVAIAALPNVHWTSGGRLDLVRIGQACRNLGAALVLDLTQSLGALPFDVNDVQPDFAVAASYKWLLGPYSTGLMYVAPRWHNGSPLEEGWIQRANSRDFSSLILYCDTTMPARAALTWASARISRCCPRLSARCSRFWNGRFRKFRKPVAR